MINCCERTDLTGISINADVVVASINGLKDASTVSNMPAVVIMDMSEDMFEASGPTKFFLKLQMDRVTTSADVILISSEEVII